MDKHFKTQCVMLAFQILASPLLSGTHLCSVIRLLICFVWQLFINSQWKRKIHAKIGPANSVYVTIVLSSKIRNDISSHDPLRSLRLLYHSATMHGNSKHLPRLNLCGHTPRWILFVCARWTIERSCNIPSRTLINVTFIGDIDCANC